ncbi:hypothetical protein CU098_002894, partial [Rhizopus stolonifer]
MEQTESLFKYIRKEKKKDVIILSSDEEDNSESLPSPLPSAIIEGSQRDPIPLDDSDEEMTMTPNSISLDEFELSDMDEDPIFQTDLVYDNKPELNIVYHSKPFECMDSIEPTPIPPLNTPPTTVKTYIPPNMDKFELLRIMEVYLQSVTDLPGEKLGSMTTVEPRFPRRTRHSDYYQKMQDSLQSQSTQSTLICLEPNYPYVPNRAWYNSTWEDWAQLDAGDILHCPFTSSEIETLTHLVDKHVRKSGTRNKGMIDIWQYVATFLPGRTARECKWFWADYAEQQHNLLFSSAVVIRRRKDPAHHLSKHHLLGQRGQTGIRHYNALRKLHWSNMTRENTITD